jgi:hypothetical protein
MNAPEIILSRFALMLSHPASSSPPIYQVSIASRTCLLNWHTRVSARLGISSSHDVPKDVNIHTETQAKMYCKKERPVEALASFLSFHPFFNTVVSQKQEMQTRENTYKEKGVCMCRSHMLVMYPKQ